MNKSSGAIIGWLEKKRRRDRTTAAVISVLALGSGAGVFLVTTLLIYAVLYVVSGAFYHSVFLPGVVALALTGWFYARSMRSGWDVLDLRLDPMGFWIIKDICSVGPRLIREGLRQVRCCEILRELDVAACAQALAYLATQNAAVKWEDLTRHCSQLSWDRLREQLLLLDGVLFLGKDSYRITLMEPFRLWLRSMLKHEQQAAEQDREPAQPGPEPAPGTVPLNEPEHLSAYEILGLSPSASFVEIKTAYRKRMKACHPDLFAGMDQQTKALAERWTKALNAAYATLNPRQRGARRR